MKQIEVPLLVVGGGVAGLLDVFSAVVAGAQGSGCGSHDAWGKVR